MHQYISATTMALSVCVVEACRCVVKVWKIREQGDAPAAREQHSVTLFADIFHNRWKLMMVPLRVLFNGRLALCYSWLRATGFYFIWNFGEVGCLATSKSSL